MCTEDLILDQAIRTALYDTAHADGIKLPTLAKRTTCLLKENRGWNAALALLNASALAPMAIKECPYRFCRDTRAFFFIIGVTVASRVTPWKLTRQCHQGYIGALRALGVILASCR
jgi:hypothetical protein